MEKIMIELKTIYEIKHILDYFKDDLKSLRQGEIYRNLMAEKFYNYGKVLCLLENNMPCAFIAFYCNDTIMKTSYISMIVVKKECRGNGSGKLLVREVENYSAKNGMSRIKLEVAKKNDAAILFYEKNGYRLCEENIDSFFYQKKLNVVV